MRTFIFLYKVDGTYNQTQAIFANKATINTVGVFLHKYVCMCMQHETDGALPPTMDFAISNSFWLMSPLLYPSSQLGMKTVETNKIKYGENDYKINWKW